MIAKIAKFLCAIAKALGGCLETKPLIKPAATINIHLMSSILLDKLEEMGCQAPIYLPDLQCKTYRVEDVKSCESLKEISGIKYQAENMDCDDAAAMLFGKWAGLAWTNVHALNWFIDDNETFWFVEPQTGVLSKELENWQGMNIRFFLGR